MTERNELAYDNPLAALEAEDAKRPGEIADRCGACGAERCDCAPTAEGEAADTTRSTAAASPLIDATPAALVFRFDPRRFAERSRVECGQSAGWDAAFLAKRVGPEALLGLSEYLTQLGLELRRRHIDWATALLRAETEEWRARGCPGAAPLVDREGRVTRREGPSAERARAAMAELEGL